MSCLSFSIRITPINITLVPPTPANNSVINYSSVVFDATVNVNAVQCLLFLRHSPNTDQLWSDVRHLQIYGGRFDYGALWGVNNYASLTMSLHSIGVGERQTCYLLTNGSSVCYGANSLGENTSYNGGNAIAVTAGQQHTCYLLSNGSSKCYGGNWAGQSKAYTGADAIALSANYDHTCYLLSNGNSICYGSSSGECGVPGQTMAYRGGNAIAVAAGHCHTCYLLSNGNSTCYGDDTCYGNTPCTNQSTNYAGGNAIAVSAGRLYTCYLLSNGNSACYGDDTYGQSTNYAGGNAIAVSAGESQACYLLSNGNSVCYGKNSDGPGEATNYTGGNAIDVVAGWSHTCYLLSNGNSICYGSNSDRRSDPYTGGNLRIPFANASYTYYYDNMLVKNVSSHATANYSAHLGDANYTVYANCTGPAATWNVSDNRTFAVETHVLISGVANTTLPGETTEMITWATDKNTNATVNYGTTLALVASATNSSYSPSNRILITGLAANTTYYYNVTSCTAAGLCNHSGVFSFTTDITPPSINFTAPTPLNASIINYTGIIVNITLSENASQCLLLVRDPQNPGKLWSNVKHLGIYGGAFDYNASMGANNYSSFNMNSRMPMAIGERQSCYLLTNGNSVCYGSDSMGELVNYAGGDAIAAAGGQQFTCYLRSNGNSTCYGDSRYQQTTSYTGGNAIALCANTEQACYLLSNGNSVCYGNGAGGRTTNYSGGNAMGLACGHLHTCYLLSNGNSACYGDTTCNGNSPCIGSAGQSTNYTGGNAVAVSAGRYYTCYLLSNGSSACYGENGDGQSTNYTGGDAVSLWAGEFQACYLRSNGNSVCYGRNSDGPGEATNYSGGDAIGVVAGWYHTCYLVSNGSSVCYGSNTNHRSDPYMGGNLLMPFAASSYALQVNNAGNATTANSPVQLGDGNYAIYANCTDFTGNSNLSDTRLFSIETFVTIYNLSGRSQADEVSAMVNWSTDKNANSTVNYGTTIALGSSVTEPFYFTFHTMTLTGLTANTTYYYNVTSCDPLGICNSSAIFNFSTDITPPLLNFVYPTPANGSAIGYTPIVINATLSENVSQCLFSMPNPYNPSNLWSGIKHLGVYGGRFDYNASMGVNNYSSFTMHQRIPLFAGNNWACYILNNGNGACAGGGTNYTGGDAIAAAVGDNNVCYLLSNGNSACYGDNAYGQSTNYTGGDAIAIASGNIHTCYLVSNGSSVCYGYNFYGQSTNYTGTDAIALSAGLYQTCYLLSNGNSTCYGGSGATNYTGGDAIAVGAGGAHTCYVLSNGNSVCYGTNIYGESNSYTGGNAIALASAPSHTCYLLSNGNSACSGDGTYYETLSYSNGNALAVTAGDFYTCYLMTTGSSVCYGSGGNSRKYSGGDLKIPFSAPSMTLVNANNYTTATYALSPMHDSVYTVTVNCTDFAGNSNVSNTVFSVETYLVISNVSGRTQPGEVSAVVNWSTDKNSNSTVNYGTTTSLGTFSTDPSHLKSHSMTLIGLTANLTYYYNVTSCNPINVCNSSGPFNFSTDITPASITFVNPTPINASVINYTNIVVNVTLNENVSQCMVFMPNPLNSGLWTNVKHLGIYGGSFDYNASQGVNNYTSFPMQQRLPLAGSGYTTCYLRSNGNSICYGNNSDGQAINYSGGDALAVSAGMFHTCYLLSSGNSACYGDDTYGQVTNYSGGDAIAVSAGSAHTCYLLSSGNSACYGDDTYGQVTNYSGGDAIAVSAGSAHTCYLLSDGNAVCYGNNQCNGNTPCTGSAGQSTNYSGGDAIALSAGVSHTCYLLSNGNSTCYGENNNGQANNYTGANAIAVAAGDSQTCYLLSTGNAICRGPTLWGFNYQYGGGDAIGLSAGIGHTCYLLSNGNASCSGCYYWDRNEGQCAAYTGGDLKIPFSRPALEVNNSNNATTGNYTLPILPDGVYVVRVNCTDMFGNSNYSDTTFSLETFVAITNVSARSQADEVSAVVNWTTDKNSNSTVNYGATPALGIVVTNSSNSKLHGVLLTGLATGTTYYYNVSSCDPIGICNSSGTFNFTTGVPAPSIDFVDPTLQNDSLINYQHSVFNVTLNENATQCQLFVIQNQSNIWTDVRHLDFYGGVFDYNASMGVGNYSSFNMLNRNPISTGSNTCYLLSNGNSACYGGGTNYTGGNAVAVSGSCYLLSNGNSACYGGTNYTGGDAIAISSNGYTCYLLSNGNSTCDGSYSMCIMRGRYIRCNAGANLVVPNYTGGDAIAVAAGGLQTCYLLSNGNSHCDAAYSVYDEATDYTGGDAIAVSAGFYHTCYLLSNGNSACYGRYYKSGCISGGPFITFIDGQDIPMPNYTGGDAIAVSSGAEDTCYLLTNGSSICYGDGSVCYGVNPYGLITPYTGGNIAIPFANGYQMAVHNASASTTASITLPTIHDGSYFFYARCKSPTGNPNVTETRSFTLDDTPPVIDLLSPANLSSLTSSSVSLRFVAVDNMSATMSCNLSLDGVFNQTNLLVLNDTQTAFVVNDLTLGQHNWSVSCTDDANNTGSSVTRFFYSVLESAIRKSGSLDVSITPVCGGFTALVRAAGSPVPSAFVDVRDITHGTETSSYTDRNGQAQFDGCGMRVNVTAMTGQGAQGSIYETVQCAPCGCTSDSDCGSDESCKDGSCQPKNQPPIKPPSTNRTGGSNVSVANCSRNSDCTAKQSCNAGTCANVTGQCGYIANHAWITYECGPEEGCPLCSAGKICINRACTQPATIIISGKDFVGENVTLTVTYPAGPCASCALQLSSPSGTKENGSTDANGKFSLKLNEKGTYTVTLVRESRAVDIVAAPAPPPLEAASIPTVVYNALAGPQPWLMVVIVMVVVLVVYLRYRGKRG